jgi:hypothetical protein
MDKQMNKWHIALAIHHCDSLVTVGNINNSTCISSISDLLCVKQNNTFIYIKLFDLFIT